MKNYLSFGGGVNSVAMMLLLMDEGMEFGPGKDCESVYVDHECDWPETLTYIKMFQHKYPLTIIKPEYKRGEKSTFNNLYEYCIFRNLIPLRQNRWCTKNFKVDALHRYFVKPCYVNIGFATEESHRAKLLNDNGMEHRYPLLERNISRKMCNEIIQSHNLPIPIKSGCWFCPFQRLSQWKKLRRNHPELWCKAVTMEKQSMEYALSKGRSKENSTLVKPYLLTEWIDSRDSWLFDELAYPPCQCGL